VLNRAPPNVRSARALEEHASRDVQRDRDVDSSVLLRRSAPSQPARHSRVAARRGGLRARTGRRSRRGISIRHRGYYLHTSRSFPHVRGRGLPARREALGQASSAGRAGDRSGRILDQAPSAKVSVVMLRPARSLELSLCAQATVPAGRGGEQEVAQQAPVDLRAVVIPAIGRSRRPSVSGRRW
jgi:hypothetical protein